jgi:hypothetical protein
LKTKFIGDFLRFPTHPYSGKQNQGYSDMKAGSNTEFSRNQEMDSVLEQGQELVPELSYKNKLARNDV